MRCGRRRPLVPAAALGLAAAAACGSAPAPDLVLTGGKVFTADSTRPWAEAVAIRGGRIVAVGTTAEVRGLAATDTKSYQLCGHLVVPGFNDAHDHLVPPTADYEVVTEASPIPDPAFALVRDSLRAAVGRHPAGTWLSVTVGPRVLDDPAARRAALDAVASRHPVVLEAWTGHGIVLNSAALSAIHLDDQAPAPLGGRMERDRSGRLTGLLEEYADWVAARRIVGRYPDSALAAAVRRRAGTGVALGITSVQNMSGGIDPARMPEVLRRAALPIRLRLVPMPMTTAKGRDLGERAALEKARGPLIEVSGAKWILDGTPLERLAALREPYADRPGWTGHPDFPADTIRQILREAVEESQQPLLHIVGDSTMALTLRLMTEVAPDSVWRRLRPRIEHGEGLMTDLVPLAARLGVIVVQNPSHFALGPAYTARYGADRGGRGQLFRSLPAAGVRIAIGSDGPQDPFLNLMLATMHPDNPAEAVTLQQAVTAYTLGSAYAEGKDAEKGSLAVGKLADLAVLSQDIFAIPATQLPGTTSLLTLVGGRVVHEGAPICGPR